MTGEAPSLRCVACSIFQPEIEALQAAGRLDLPVAYLHSMLHMVPDRLETRLQQTLDECRQHTPGCRVVLTYGDCCSHMADFEAVAGTCRTAGINCCEILLGREAYRRLRREGAFFLMPEWALTWRQVFIGQLGLMGPCARAFMQEMHTRLVYLDTGIQPVPHETLAEASEFLGLPVEVLPVSLDHLQASLEQAAHLARAHGAD